VAVEDALASFPDVICATEGAQGAFCTADPDQLHRILVNLLRNGARVMAGQNRDPGLIVRALTSGKLVAIMVEDRGPGVPEKVRARLFEPFVTGDRNNAGTGLGLTIARELARAMGGDVALLRSDKNGAVFQVTLPAGQ
jgi:signal transduction histidine kinase